MTEDEKYVDIKNIIKNNNSFVTNALVIAGEANKGFQPGVSALVYTRLLFEKKLYTPVTFSHLVGSSVGSIIISIILNACYLYEMIDTPTAIEYIDSVIEKLNFDTIRKILLDNGNGTCLGDDFNLFKIFIRLMTTGGLFLREQLISFLEGNIFPDYKGYFKTTSFYNWLEDRLTTVYIVCHNSIMTQQFCYTGDKTCISNQYTKYVELNPYNLIETIIASSAIPFIYAPPTLDTGLKVSDGSVAAISPIEVMNSILNRYLHSNDEVFNRIYKEFGIKEDYKKGFCITLNNINLQRRFTDVLELNNQSPFDFLKATKSVLNLIPNAIYNSRASLGAMGSLISKPFVPYLSSLNYAKITLRIKDRYYKRFEYEFKSIDKIQTSDRIPTICLAKDDEKNKIYQANKKYFEDSLSYTEKYKKYKCLTSNLILSTYLNSYIESDTSTTFILYDTIVRCPFDNKLVESLIELVIKNDSGFYDQQRTIGILQGNQLFDYYLIQTFSKKAAIQKLHKK
jgi:hypothetical protein